MKKAITIILVISLCISSCSYASDYHIEWFDIENVSRVQYLDEERIAVFTDTLAKDELAALCDYNGNPLTEFDYTFILRLKKGLYTGASVYFVNPANKESKIDAFDIDGNIIESVPCEFEKENWCLIPGENLQADISAFEEKNIYPEHIMGNYVVASKGSEIALADLNGNLLSGFDYHISYCFNTSLPGKIALVNMENSRLLYADIYKKQFFRDIICVSDEALPDSFVYINDNGKYSIVYLESFKTLDEEYDEFIDELHGSYTFIKDGKRYVTDKYGMPSYIGDKSVCGVSHGCYVIEEDGKLGICDKNFNFILPCEYEDIDIIAKDLYIVKKDGISKLIGQGKELLASDSEMRSVHQYIATKTGIYDIEGKFIIKNDWKTSFATGYDFIVFDENTKRAGKLVSENSNPLVEIDGEILYSDTLSRIKNNITLIPLRAMAEETGFNTEYIEETKEIRLTKEDKEIVFKIGDKKAISNGVEITLNAAPEIINNRTLIPARAVSDAFGYDIEWDGERRLVEITTN